MSATFVSLYIHIVFSTKNRHPWLTDKFIARMHDYLGETLRGLGATSIRIGGVEDHVHLLVGIKATHCISELVREIKKASTNWMHEELPTFSWQVGYGVFSVSPERVKGVSKYIDNQAEHHKTMTFVEERIMLYRLAGIDFDPNDLD